MTDGLPPTVKSGFLRRYKKGFLGIGRGWKTAHIVLYRDSMLMYFSQQGDTSPDGCVELRRVREFIAVGPYTQAVPNRPDFPPGTTERHVIALPTTPSRQTEIVWLLCQDDEDLNSWMKAMCSTLPPPPQRSPVEPSAPAQQSENPPPYSPYSNPNQQQQGHNGPAPVHGSQVSPGGGNTTMVVQGGCGGGGGGDMAAGMMMGSMMGMHMGMMMGTTLGIGVGTGWGNTDISHVNHVTEINNTNIENNFTSDTNFAMDETQVNYADQGFQGSAHQGDQGGMFAGQGFGQGVYEQGGFVQGGFDQGGYMESGGYMQSDFSSGGFDDVGGFDFDF